MDPSIIFYPRRKIDSKTPAGCWVVCWEEDGEMREELFPSHIMTGRANAEIFMADLNKKDSKAS